MIWPACGKYSRKTHPGTLNDRLKSGSPSLRTNSSRRGQALRLDEMCSPIGLKIGAQTPEEIGISIVAELIWRKRLDLRDQPRINRSDLDVDVILNLPKTGEQRSLVTILSSTGSVPRSAGACMTVTRDRRITGSIGGGCSESEIAAGAAENTGTGRYYTALVDLSGAAAEEERMVCGGRMTCWWKTYCSRIKNRIP